MVKKSAENIKEKATLKKSVEAHAGTARRQATEIETVLISRMKEEDHRVETEIDRNLPQDQETNQTNKKETLLQIIRRKIRYQETTKPNLMIHKTQQQQIPILTGLKLKMTHQKRERNQNIDREKVVVTETEESCQATNPDKLEEEQTQHRHLRHKFSRELQTNFLSMRGWKSA